MERLNEEELLAIQKHALAEAMASLLVEGALNSFVAEDERFDAQCNRCGWTSFSAGLDLAMVTHPLIGRNLIHQKETDIESVGLQIKKFGYNSPNTRWLELQRVGAYAQQKALLLVIGQIDPQIVLSIESGSDGRSYLPANWLGDWNKGETVLRRVVLPQREDVAKLDYGGDNYRSLTDEEQLALMSQGHG